MESLTLKKGAVIFRQGSPSSCIYDVTWGVVGIYDRYGEPGETLLDEVRAGECFGEMGVIEGCPHSATAVALEKGTCVKAVTQAEFEAYFREKPAKVMAIMQNLSRRLREVSQKYLQACRAVAESTEAARAGRLPDDRLHRDLEELAKTYRSSGHRGT